MRRKRSATLVFSTLLLLFTGCGMLERRDFEQASNDKSTDGLRQFLAKHPDSQYRAKAEELLHERMYEQAKAFDTADAWAAFIGSAPTGKHTDEAKRRIELLEAFAHIRTGLMGGDSAAMARAMVNLRAIKRTDEMMQFVPALIEALEDQTLIQLWDKPDNVIMASGLIINAGDKPWGFMIVSVSGEAAKTLQYITGQNLGENPKKWESWWAAKRG